jgi:hypothetical protein
MDDRWNDRKTAASVMASERYNVQPPQDAVHGWHGYCHYSRLVAEVIEAIRVIREKADSALDGKGFAQVAQSLLQLVSPLPTSISSAMGSSYQGIISRIHSTAHEQLQVVTWDPRAAAPSNDAMCCALRTLCIDANAHCPHARRLAGSSAAELRACGRAACSAGTFAFDGTQGTVSSKNHG